MSKNSYIGIFDSGIGGLTVAKNIVKSLPNENIIYFGDTAHVPYGTKSKRQITQYVLNDVKFLNMFDIKAVVIACNTADSVAKDKLIHTYPDLPVFGVVEPASELAAKTTKNGRIGVIATKATTDSQAYNKAIAKAAPEAEVFSTACPLLVPLVENERYHRGDKVTEMVLKEYLDPLIELDIDTLVLGCTHYPLLQGIIQELYPELNVISSSAAAADRLKETLASADMLKEKPGSDRMYFVSDDCKGFAHNARIFMGDSLGGKVRQVDIEDTFELHK